MAYILHKNITNQLFIIPLIYSLFNLVEYLVINFNDLWSGLGLLREELQSWIPSTMENISLIWDSLIIGLFSFSCRTRGFMKICGELKTWSRYWKPYLLHTLTIRCKDSRNDFSVPLISCAIRALRLCTSSTMWKLERRTEGMGIDSRTWSFSGRLLKVINYGLFLSHFSKMNWRKKLRFWVKSF